MPALSQPWSSRPGPPITPASALRRLADRPTLLALLGCGLGPSYVAWGESVEPVVVQAADLAGFFDGLSVDMPDSAVPVDADVDADRPGWSGFTGGHIVQCDYEAPATPPRAWRVDGYAAWTADGACTLHARGDALLARMAEDLTAVERPCSVAADRAALEPAWHADGHVERVTRIRSLIADGDIYQANLTLPFTAAISGAHADLAVFLALTDASPAPFSAFLRAPGRSTVVSHSPECFLASAGERMVSKPIKGTRRRIAGQDERTRAELSESAKDRAELAMIVDLVRHDLGRVAATGSVRVESAASVLDLPTLHHLEATISARLRPGSTLGEAIAAAFPPGSVTGAPKIRAMQIIQNCEVGARGAYCGAFGWYARGIGCRLAVAIRTLTIAGGVATLHAGSGIVADSDPVQEWLETCAKAEAMAAAVGARLP